MAFITKLDFSDNRQVKQNIETNTLLSGGTSFGVPFNQLPSGADPLNSGVTLTENLITSNFSGNSTTTIYSWYTPIMSLADNVLSALTPSNSGTTQNSGDLFSASTSTTIDGNVVNLSYTGISFDLTPTLMVDLGGGNYSGSVSTNVLKYLTAGTIDYTGRTIWVDVSGITRTDGLIINKNPIIGYVLTCVDGEGKVEFQPASATTTSATTYWSGGTGIASVVVKNSQSVGLANYSLSEGYQTTASGIASHAEGKGTTASGNQSHAEGDLTKSTGYASHSEGRATTASGDFSHAGGNESIASGTLSFVHGSGSTASGVGSMVLGNNITGTTNNTVYVNSLNIKTVGAGPSVIDLGVDALGNVVNQASDLRLKENIEKIDNALDIIKSLRGVRFNWKDKEKGGDGIKLGFIAQEVNDVDPVLTYTYEDDVNKIMTVNYREIIPIIVEAIKDIVLDEKIIKKETFIETQTVKVEDNNIEFNFNGDESTSIGGGFSILNALGSDNAINFKLNNDKDFETNTRIIAQNFNIPNYTPKYSKDVNGKIGDITFDDNFVYIKTNNGWKRSELTNF